MSRAPADPVLARLAQAAGKGKTLRFDEFQRIVLYDPEVGYFSRASDRAARHGDFITAPETSPLFAASIARALLADAQALRAEEFHIVELGAGRATFARDLWRTLRHQPLARDLHLHLVETSAAARATWKETLASVPAERWTAYASEAELPTSPWPSGALFANELFDNLPVRRVMMTQSPQEIVVRVRPTGVREELVPAPIELSAYLEAQGVRLVLGQTAEICLEAPLVLGRNLARFRRGAALLIDYGDEARHLYHPERFLHGTLAANRGHATHTDFYANLGEQDLTAHVNFTPLSQTLDAAGYRRLFFGTQMRFLLDHGFAELLQEEVAATQDEFAKLKITQRAKQLYHPDAMGEAFRVLHARSA